MHPPAVSGDLCWKEERKAKLPTKDPLSWPPVLTQLLLQVKSSPVSYLKPPETKNLNYPKCFLKAKSTCGPKQLCKLQKREMFSLALLRREFLVFLGQAGRRKVSSGKARGKGNCLLLGNIPAMAHSYRQKGYAVFTLQVPGIEKGAFPTDHFEKEVFMCC